MVKLYYQNGSSIRQRFHALREIYDQHNRLTASVTDYPPPTRRRNV